VDLSRVRKCQYEGCENRATIMLGRKDHVKLCDTCAAKPEFDKLKIRTRLPKPLSPAMVGKCFYDNRKFYLILELSKNIDRAFVGISVQCEPDWEISVKKEVVYMHRFDTLIEITREKFDRVLMKCQHEIQNMTKISQVDLN
jgi:hypothetical protein